MYKEQYEVSGDHKSVFIFSITKKAYFIFNLNYAGMSKHYTN